jgi:crossover junction endodeoxyribonuclease RusA
MSKLIFELPYPISTNRYWRKFNNRIVLSQEAKDYKSWLKWTYHKIRPILGYYKMQIIFHPKLTKKGVESKVHLDLSNTIKLLEDALQGVAYENDRDCRDLHIIWGLPKLEGGVTVKVEEWEEIHVHNI